MNATGGRVYFWDERVLYVGPDVPSGLHAHHAVQVCVTLSEPLRFRSSPRAPWRRCEGAVIPSDVPHQTEPVIPLLATFWLDADTADATRLAGGDIRPIEPPILAAIRPLLHGCWRDSHDPGRAAEMLDEVVRILAPGPEPARPVDLRVERARTLLRAAPSRRLPLAELAAAVALSPSRLAHVLRPRLGLPIRRYLLWLRLRDALRELVGGSTITEAAHAAGFADASHLDRTFRRMLGFTPSAALRASQFVQAASAPGG
jgi:AraC-like DNA-binding protein